MVLKSDHAAEARTSRSDNVGFPGLVEALQRDELWCLSEPGPLCPGTDQSWSYWSSETHKEEKE